MKDEDSIFFNNELILFKENENIQKCGLNIRNFLSKIEDNIDKLNNLSVPVGLIQLPENIVKKEKRTYEQDDNEILDNEIFDKLLDMARHQQYFKEKKMTKKKVKQTNKKTKKNKMID